MSASALAAPTPEHAADAHAAPVGSPAPKSRTLRWTHDIFTDPQTLLLVLVVVPLAVLLGPHAMWFLRPPKLPDSWVRPSTLGGLYGSALPLDTRSVCGNTWASAPDPWARGGDRKVQVLAYCEDAAALPGGAALLSCDPGRRKWNTVMGPLQEPGPRGALWVQPSWENVSAALPKPTLLPMNNYPTSKSFHPLGLHVFKDELYVVNHGAAATSIEVFTLQLSASSDQQGYQATWVRSISSPLLTHTANSLSTVSSEGQDWLLVTNDHFIARRPPPAADLAALLAARLPQWLAPVQPAFVRLLSNRRIAAALAQIETALSLPGGWVASVPLPLSPSSSDSQSEHVEVDVLATGIPFANGIATSPGSESVAVASTMGPYLQVFHLTFSASPEAQAQAQAQAQAGASRTPRRTLRPTLTPDQKIYMPMLPDNLHFTPLPQASGDEAVLAALPAEAHGSHEAADLERGRLEANGLKAQTKWGGAALVVAGHPKPRGIVRYAHDPAARPSGSWVVAVSGAWREAGDGAVAGKRGGLRTRKAQEDGAPVSAASRAAVPPAWDWSLKTLYEANEGASGGVGVSTSTSALWDPRHAPGTGQGSLLVTGLYSRGTMMCKHVGLE